MESIHIRPTRAVEPQLGTLARAMYLEGERRHLPWCPEEVEAELAYHTSQPNTHCSFVAEMGGRLIGFIGGCIKPFDFSPLSRLCSTFIYVSPESRGSWAFLKLLRAFEAWAIERNVRYVEVGMSSGVNPERLEIMFSKIGYRLVGNVLAFRPDGTAPQGVPRQDLPVSRAVAPEEVDRWEGVFRSAHAHSSLGDIPFDSASFRRTFALVTARGASRLYEVLDEGQCLGLYGMHLHKIALCRAWALKCFVVIGMPGAAAGRQSMLRVVSEKLPEYQAASGAMEIFWLTFGAPNPSATMRAMRASSYRNLGGTFLKEVRPIGNAAPQASLSAQAIARP